MLAHMEIFMKKETLVWSDGGNLNVRLYGHVYQLLNVIDQWTFTQYMTKLR